MASPNVELVRSIVASWGHGDFSSADWADPAIEYVHVDGPSPGRWSGLEGMSRGWRDALRAWEGLRIEADEYRELDDTHVLVLTHLSGRGKTSGLDLGDMDTRSVGRFRIDDGKVTSIVWYWDREQGLAELGLAEMASPNVELVRSIRAAWERGDFSSTDWADPEIEFEFADLPDGVASRGVDEMARRIREFFSAWDSFSVEADAYRELDDERVLVTVRFRGLGKTSHLDLGQMQSKGAELFHVHDRKVTRLVLYGDRGRALADLGIDLDAQSDP